jgi:sulfur carrier protein
MSIIVHINGKKHTLEGVVSIAGLLEALNIPLEHVVVEQNGEIVEKPSYEHVNVESGDRLELIRFVGGG